MHKEIKPIQIPQVLYDPSSQPFITKAKVMHLHAWFMENMPAKDMTYKNSAEEQIMFLRDKTQIFFTNFMLKTVQVVSTHVSKSITLPVYHIVLKDGLELILRGNFHDWKISVNSPFEIEIPNEILTNYTLSGEKMHPCYCEGFDESWIWDSYMNNKQKFTIEINSSLYELYTFLFLLSLEVNKQSRAIESL